MTSIKLKFRPAATPGKEGTLVFQLIHGRSVRRISSGYKIFAGEWDGQTGQILLPSPSSPRYSHLASIKSGLEWELNRLKGMVRESEKTTGTVDLDGIAAGFQPCLDAPGSVFNFIREQIRRKEKLGRARSAETYRSTLNSLTRFCEGRDITFDMMDGGLMNSMRRG